MLTILFKLLSILGILLLILLGIALAVILLVLFFPISYKASGEKSAGTLSFRFRASWLFGLLRISYSYPVPGKLLIKLLFFNLYDSSAEKKSPPEAAQRKQEKTAEASEASKPTESSGQIKTVEKSEDASPQPTALSEEPNAADTTGPADDPVGRIAGFFHKIQYTVRKIYDKIKHILENITFYKELWNDPDTQGLLRHAGRRVGHILRRLKPGKLTVNAIAGTGSPDTTGYLYGIYGMLLPKLGKGICITPDFEQAILEGDFKASGHFTVACVLFHSLRLLLDRRLRQLVTRIRQYQKNKK